MNVRDAILSVPNAAFARQLIRDTDSMEEKLMAVCSDAKHHREDLERIIGAGGKRLRPMLAWTVWHMTGQKMPILPLMCMLELMHTASLIHDDYVDQAEKRRGAETISHRSGGIAAHECGDYLLAKAMEFLETYRGTGINEALSVVSQEMCLGELDQRAGLYQIRDLTRETYDRRIRRKTALLMAESCRSGAVAGGADKETAERFRCFGEYLGLAFQIRDDILDWEPDRNTGKAPLIDIKDGVMTLPVILAFEKMPDKLVEILERRDKSDEESEKIREWILSSGALSQAEKELNILTDKAVKTLDPVKECAEKKALILLSKTISEVKKGA